VPACLPAPPGGFQLARDKAPYKTPDITDTVNLWKPPCLNCRCACTWKKEGVGGVLPGRGSVKTGEQEVDGTLQHAWAHQ